MRTTFKDFISCRSGSTLILIGLMFVVLMMVVALVVDIGRLYAVQSKAQNASDAALLGAVATINSTDINLEMGRLFNANYPVNYMGSTIGNITITEVSSGVYEATFTVTVPTTVLDLFAADTVTFTILSQVTRGYEVTPNQRLEVTLVLDNTGSMSGAKIEALKTASHSLVEILFGDAETLANLRVSLVPYDVAVNIGPGRAAWVQAPYVAGYQSHENSGDGVVSNRNHDAPPNAYEDISDAAPQSEETRFRLPYNSPLAFCSDTVDLGLPLMQFALNAKSQIHSAIDTMTANGCTRINVGLMWGWFTLSPNWQGVWIPGDITLPQSPDNLLDKAIVLMTDGLNTVFNSTNNTSDDDNTTASMCAAIKNQGIKIYTVGFGSGGNINEPLLEECATIPSYYFHAPTEADLQAAFNAIADDLVYTTLRLSK